MEAASIESAVILLLLLIAAVGIAMRHLRMPYPVALVITGLVVGAALRSPLPFLHGLALERLQLTPDWVIVLLLPALLFEATLHIEAARLRGCARPYCQSDCWRCRGYC